MIYNFIDILQNGPTRIDKFRPNPLENRKDHLKIPKINLKPRAYQPQIAQITKQIN